MLSVVNYHYIRNAFTAKYDSIFGLTPSQLLAQIELLSGYGTIIEPENLSNQILTSPKRYILLTFDDGLREQYEIALPVLKSKGIKAMFFVSTMGIETQKVCNVHKIHLIRSIISDAEFIDYIFRETGVSIKESEKEVATQFYRFDNASASQLKYLLNVLLDTDQSTFVVSHMFEQLFNEVKIHEQLYMDNAQIRELGYHNMLGSHAHSHIPLGILAPQEIRDELSSSKAILTRLANTSIKHISYPYGSGRAVNQQVFDIADTVGYKYGYTTHIGNNTSMTSNLNLCRFDCNDAPGGKNYNEQLWK
jgi:peptidoglycan/xylan/chitin deacetylase (PgdA/CDA1 family)